jgi:hypothetical protein
MLGNVRPSNIGRLMDVVQSVEILQEIGQRVQVLWNLPFLLCFMRRCCSSAC